jgi:hypothetical protein
MGRKKQARRPPPPPAGHDPALLEAVRAALAALSAARQEATPSAVEGWIKINRHDVWSSITTAAALKAAIETASREASPPTSPAEGARVAGGRKKTTRQEAPAQPPVKPEPARTNGKHEATPAVNGLGRAAQAPARSPVQAAAEADSDRGRGRRGHPRAANKASAAQRSEHKRVGEKSLGASVAPRQPDVAGYDPTRSEMLLVLGIAREHGGVAKLRKLVQAVKELADQAGGLDRLAVCLDALEEFGVK